MYGVHTYVSKYVEFNAYGYYFFVAVNKSVFYECAVQVKMLIFLPQDMKHIRYLAEKSIFTFNIHRIHCYM